MSSIRTISYKYFRRNEMTEIIYGDRLGVGKQIVI